MLMLIIIAGVLLKDFTTVLPYFGYSQLRLLISCLHNITFRIAESTKAKTFPWLQYTSWLAWTARRCQQAFWRKKKLSTFLIYFANVNIFAKIKVCVYLCVVHLQDKVTPSTKSLWPGASFQNRSYWDCSSLFWICKDTFLTTKALWPGASFQNRSY
jgi:hypothetical protein